MRRSASELIRNLETRIARLEKLEAKNAEHTKQASRRKIASGMTLRSHILGAWDDFKTEIRKEMMLLIQADGLKQYRPRYKNSVSFGSQKVDMSWDQTGKKADTMEVMITGKGIQTVTFTTKNLANMDPKETAEWIWMKTPASFKR